MRQQELYYTHPESMMDNPGLWASEHGYLDGVGSDGGETVDMMTTPSGAPSTPAGAKPWYESIANAVSSIVPVAANVYAQKKFTDLNIARAQQGLAPLSAQQFSTQYQVPLAQVQVGPNDSAKKALYIGGAVLGGLVLLRVLKKI